MSNTQSQDEVGWRMPFQYCYAPTRTHRTIREQELTQLANFGDTIPPARHGSWLGIQYTMPRPTLEAILVAWKLY